MNLVYLLVATTVLLCAAGEDFQCPTELDVDVLVLGAGISGIAAAQKLHEFGISNFLIIEGTDRIGGRIKSTKLGNVTVNLGANWITGVDPTGQSPKENPIWALKQKCGVKTVITGYDDFIYYDKQGNRVDGDAFRWDEWYEAIDEVLNMSVRMPPLPKGAFQRGFKVINEDINVQDALELAGWIPETYGDAMVQFLEFDWDFSEKPEDTGLKTYKAEVSTLDGDFGDGDYYVIDERGYDQIVQCIADEFLGKEEDPRILLNTPVKQIWWRDECVCVDVQLSSDGQQRLCGRYAINTFSSGVLYNSVFSEDPFVKIWPPLPQWKQDVISESDLVQHLFLFAKFDYIFWDDHEFIARAAFKGDAAQVWPIFQPLGLSNGKFSPEIPPDTPILWATVTGDEARRLDTLTQEELIEDFMKVLRTMYGYDIPMPNEVATQNWLSDPFFRGTWMNSQVGAGTDRFDLLRAPVGAMFFSGEHTSVKYSGYTHGAYLEGQTVAQQVAFRFQN